MALGNGLSSAHNYFVPIFHPTGISNLDLWLKYNTGYTSKDDETTAAGDLDDNDRIKQWDDQSGNNNHAVQAAQSDMPRFKYADRSLRFANRAKYMNLTSDIIIGASEDFTIIMRLKVESNFDNLNGLVGASGNDFFRISDDKSFRVKIRDDVQSNWIEASDSLAIDTYYIIVLTRSGGGSGELSVHVHGGAYDDREWDAAENATDSDSFAINNIGCESDDTNNFKGYMKDVLIYNGVALSDGQRGEMYTYLNNQTIIPI